jgi:hypothetical protein
MEWFFAVIIGACLFIQQQFAIRPALYWLGIAGFLLALQTVWLLPALDTRATERIKGGTGAPSSLLHWYFVGGELIKVVSLFAGGVRLLLALNR